MKDEELADKSALEYFGKAIELVDVEKIRLYKDGFLAGLKADRPQWHDLRKDPNDLPKETCEVLVRANRNKLSLYNRSEKKFTFWNYRHDCYTELHNVIAWCELPTFDKE